MTFGNNYRDPFFVDTSIALSRYEPMISANQAIGTTDEMVQKKMSYNDSLSKILDSLSKGKLDERNLLATIDGMYNLPSYVLYDKDDVVFTVTKKVSRLKKRKIPIY